MLNSITVEFIKLKRSKIMLVALAGPALVALLFFSLQASGASLQAWPFYFFAGFTAWATFMMPLTATIITTLVAQLEHGPKIWAHLLALPVPKWRVFAAKAVVTLALVAAMSLLTALLLAFGGWFAGQISPENKLIDPAPFAGLAETMLTDEDEMFGDMDVALLVKNWKWEVAERLLYIYVSAFLLIAVQLWAAFKFRNFLIPTALGIGGGFIAIFAQSSQFGVYFPWLMPFNTLGFMPEKVNMALCLGLVGGLGAMLLMLVDMSKMQIK
ncbi:ABC transporter permease [Hyphococcus sp.]|uniref:ABC transporter permease n=1 Tax=Hyphococcus sp. TaxID=2038636 RepID=UPI003CCB7DC2